MHGESTHWTEPGNVSLRYRLSGKGNRSLILFHGLTGTIETWDLVSRELETDFRVLRADQRGAGLSEKVRTPYSMPDLVEDALRVLEASQLPPPFYLGGIASGTAIAVAVAHRLNTTVAALALCAPALRSTPDRARLLVERAEAAIREGMRTVMPATVARSYPEDMITDRATYDDYISRFLAIDPVSYANANRVLSAVDLEQEIGSIRQPVLLVTGNRDVMRPPDSARPLLSAFADCHMSILDTCHLMILQAPKAVAQTMREFFASR